MIKRKLLTIFICLALMLGSLLATGLVCYADGAEGIESTAVDAENAQRADSSENTQDTKGAEGTEATEDTEYAENDTPATDKGGFAYYYGRISENIAELFEADNLDTLITWCCSVFSVLIVSLLKGSVNKLKNKISGTLDGSTAKTNELIEGYNENSKRIEELGASTDRLYEMLEEKCALDKSVSEKVSAFAEMMFLIYNGSTTLPEGLKDVLRVKYANLISSQEDSVSADKEGGASV